MGVRGDIGEVAGGGIPHEATLGRPVCYRGIGLHTGKEINMALLPAEEGTGIVFVRKDLRGEPRIKACLANVVDATRCTTIGIGAGGEGTERGEGAAVKTVEHLLAALSALGVDNCIVELDGPEVPMGDGSAAEFVRLIYEAEVVPQASRRRVLALAEPLWVQDGDRMVLALPWDGFRVGFVFVGPYPCMGEQHVEFEVDAKTFPRELAPARTIAFLTEVEGLRRAGLGLGGAADSVVLASEEGYAGPLRFPDEAARHKTLDIIGDMALVGCLHAHVIGIKSNHSMNHKLARAIAKAVNL